MRWNVSCSTIGAAMRGPNKKAGETGPNLRTSKPMRDDQIEPFLERLAVEGRAAAICRDLDIRYSALVSRRKTDPAFGERFDAALLAYADRLEAAAEDRAVRGEDKESPVKKSDPLLLAMLKARHPLYKDHVKIDQTVEDKGLRLRDLPQEERDRIRDAIERARGGDRS